MRRSAWTIGALLAAALGCHVACAQTSPGVEPTTNLTFAPSRGGGFQSGPDRRADEPAPRTDRNSQTAREQLLEKARKGGIDVYFIGDSLTRRWGATDYPELRANRNTNFFGWNAANSGWGADLIENMLWRLENGELDGRIQIHDPSTVIQCDGKHYTFGTGSGGLISNDSRTWSGGASRPDGGQSWLTGFSTLDKFAWIASFSANLTAQVVEKHFSEPSEKPKVINEQKRLLWLGVGPGIFYTSKRSLLRIS